MDGRVIVEQLGPKHAEAFHNEFVSLRHTAHDSPKVLRREARRNWKVLEQAWRVLRRAEWIEAYEQIGKRSIVAPKESLQSWEVFKSQWRDAVVETRWYGVSPSRQITTRSIVDTIFEDQERNFEFDGFDGWIKQQGQMYGAPRIQVHDEDWFDPEYDDPISLIESAVSYFSSQSNEFEDLEHYELEMEASKVDGAWAYLQYALGLDHENLWNRWKQNLTILVPTSDTATRELLDGLTRLYSEAVRCYVFGLNGAAIALCRAMVEETLVRVYGISKTSDLKALITAAESKVTPNLIRGLESVRLKGNLVLHQSKPGESAISETDVLKSLLVVKALMEQAKHVR